MYIPQRLVVNVENQELEREKNLDDCVDSN